MKELSVFVDESGNFGEYDYRAPFYIISLVFHDQTNDISKDLYYLEQELSYLGLPSHCIHAGPIIRSEDDYKGMLLENRRKILMSLMFFVRHINFSYKTIFIDKKHIRDSVESSGKLSKQLSTLIRNNINLFCSYDLIKIYYDNGQVEVTKILSSVFNAFLENVEFRKVIPSQYRLFQVADLICTLKLTELKYLNHSLSKSEKVFFEDGRTLKKNYLKPLLKKEMR